MGRRYIKPEDVNFSDDEPLVDVDSCPSCDGQFWPSDQAVVINPLRMVHAGECFDKWARYHAAEGLLELKKKRKKKTK